MSTSVTLPALGESVTEGTVSRWLKQVGDQVEADEPLLEVSTDKVDTEIPSPISGVLLEIKAAEDETVEVGAVLAVIGEASEAEGGGDTGGDTGGGDTGGGTQLPVLPNGEPTVGGNLPVNTPVLGGTPTGNLAKKPGRCSKLSGKKRARCIKRACARYNGRTRKAKLKYRACVRSVTPTTPGCGSGPPTTVVRG